MRLQPTTPHRCSSSDATAIFLTMETAADHIRTAGLTPGPSLCPAAASGKSSRLLSFNTFSFFSSFHRVPSCSFSSSLGRPSSFLVAAAAASPSRSASVNSLSAAAARISCSKQPPPPPAACVRLPASATSRSSSLLLPGSAATAAAAAAAAGPAFPSSLAAAAALAGAAAGGGAATQRVRQLCLRLAGTAAAGSRKPDAAAASCVSLLPPCLQLQQHHLCGRHHHYHCQQEQQQQQSHRLPQQQPPQQQLQQSRLQAWRHPVLLQTQQRQCIPEHSSTALHYLRRNIYTGGRSNRSICGFPTTAGYHCCGRCTAFERGKTDSVTLFNTSSSTNSIEKALHIGAGRKCGRGFSCCTNSYSRSFCSLLCTAPQSESGSKFRSRSSLRGSSCCSSSSRCDGCASISSSSSPRSSCHARGRGGLGVMGEGHSAAAAVGGATPVAPALRASHCGQKPSLHAVGCWLSSSPAAAITAAAAAGGPLAAAVSAATAAAAASRASASAAWRRQAAAGAATQAAAAAAPPAAAAAPAAAEEWGFLHAVRKKLRLRGWMYAAAASSSSDEGGLLRVPRLLLLRLHRWIVKPREKEDICLLLISFSWLLLLSGIPLYTAWKRSSRERRHPYLAEAHQIIKDNKEIQKVFGSPLLLENRADTTDSAARFKRAEIKIEGPKASGMVFVNATADGVHAGADKEDVQQKLSYAEMVAMLREQPYLLKFFIVEKLRLLVAALWSVIKGGAYSATAFSRSRWQPLDASSSSNSNKAVEAAEGSSSSPSSTLPGSSSSGGCRGGGWRIDSIFAVIQKEILPPQQEHHQQQQQMALVGKHCGENSSEQDKATATHKEDGRNSSSCQKRASSSDANGGQGSSGGSTDALCLSSEDSKKTINSQQHPHLIFIKGNPYNNPDFLPQLRLEGGDRLQRAHPVGWLVLALVTAGLLRRIIIEVLQARHRMLAYAYLRHFVSTHPHLQRLLWRAEMKRRRLREQEAQAIGSSSSYGSLSFSPSLPSAVSFSSAAQSAAAASAAGAAAAVPSLRGTSSAAEAAPDEGSVAVAVEFFTGVMKSQHIKGIASLSYWCHPVTYKGAASLRSSSDMRMRTPPLQAAAATQTHAAAATLEAYECVAELEIEASRPSDSAPFRAITSKLSLIEEPDEAAGDPPFPLIKSYLLNPHVVAPFKPRFFAWKCRGGENKAAASAATVAEAVSLACAVVGGRRRRDSIKRSS